MIVIGSEYVAFEPVKLYDFNKYNIKDRDFIAVKNRREAVFANANGVKFIVCDSLSLARQLQALANDYLFDSKIAVVVADDMELEDAIDARIDAAIYKNVIF